MNNKPETLHPVHDSPTKIGGLEAPNIHVNDSASFQQPEDLGDAQVAPLRPRPQLLGTSPIKRSGFEPPSSDDDEMNYAEITRPFPRVMGTSPPPLPADYPEGVMTNMQIPRSVSTDSLSSQSSMSSMCSTDHLIPAAAKPRDDGTSDKEIEIIIPTVQKDVSKDATKPQGKAPGSSLLSSSFNSANFIIGVSILTYPNLIERQGIVLQFLISLFACVMLTYTASILMQINELSGGVATYSAVMEKIFGTPGRRVFDMSQGFALFLLCIAFTIIMGDFGDNLAASLFNINSPMLIKFLLCGEGQFLVFPLALMPNMNSLRFTSILSICLVGFVVICMLQDSIRYMFDSGPDDPEPVYLFKPSMSIFQSLPIAIFSFQGHIILFPIYNEMRNSRLSKMKKVVQRSFGSVFSMYILLGVFGYLRLRRNIPGNVLNAYTDDSEDRWISQRWIMFCAAFAMMITVALSFPLYIFACKQVWLGIVYGNDSAPSRKTNVVFACIVFYVSVFCGLFLSDILAVIGLLGSVSAPLVVFIMPCSMALKIRPLKDSVPWHRDPFAIKCVGILSFSVYLVLSGLAYSLSSFF